MMTLREFVEKVNFFEHFRVYQPNRDCLIYESYFKVHSPYYFDEEHEETHDWYNGAYYDHNDYCRDVLVTKEYDEETKHLLDRFGDYEVFSIECSGFRPSKMYKDENGVLVIEHVKDESMPNRDYLNCFNLFIK